MKDFFKSEGACRSWLLLTTYFDVEFSTVVAVVVFVPDACSNCINNIANFANATVKLFID